MTNWLRIFGAIITVMSCINITIPASCMILAQDGKAQAVITTLADATPDEITAAKELAHYLGKVAGVEFSVVTEGQQAADNTTTMGIIQVGNQTGMQNTKPESWTYKVSGNVLSFSGARPRGVLHGVYNFLENEIGVYWWNPWEETVPRKTVISIRDGLQKSGVPGIKYRDIYMLYGYDRGRFAARNRLNREGDAEVSSEYGGSRDYGPPYHVHTLNLYLPPQEFFQTNPEWFSLIGAKRTADYSQLCMTNSQLRAYMKTRLREYIQQSRESARQQNKPAPDVFSLSQNDWGGFCECPVCTALVEKEGSQAGPLLDFVNELADDIKTDYPEIYLDTLAYFQTDIPPKNIKPRDNVIIRLCDTGSDYTRPVTDPVNAPFRNLILNWAKITKNLRIWDYAISYGTPHSFPMPSVQTYQDDMQFYRDHNVEGVFTEFEEPILTDTRDLKVWMLMKMEENPDADYDALLQTFTNGFYGLIAGPAMRQYLSMLEESSKQHPVPISMGGNAKQAAYLTLNFILKAQRLFDDTERKIARQYDTSSYFTRLRHARLSLDRATLARYPQLLREWAQTGNAPETFPLNQDEIASRALETWITQAEMRMPADQVAGEIDKAQKEIRKLNFTPTIAKIPDQFKGISSKNLFDFPSSQSRNWADIVKEVPDTQSDNGMALKLEFPVSTDLTYHSIEKYKLPMPWGVYDAINKRDTLSNAIKPEDVPGPGYNWYKLGRTGVNYSDYIYFFWSWIIQIDIGDMAALGTEYDIWARIRFEGPSFPHGEVNQKDAIFVERIILVKAD